VRAGEVEGEKVGELGDFLRGRAGEVRELCRRAHVACKFHLGGGSRHGQPRGGGQDPAAAMERRGRGAAAEAANSRGGGECAIRELQGWRPRAPGGGGVRGGRELQWKARRQGAAVSSEEAGEAWGEIKRENGREGVKVEDSNFRGFFCKNSCHVAPCQEVWT